MQLHCPPTAVFEDDAVYDALDTLVQEGAIAAYGVSVEETAQALTAIARPHVATVQIILNAFRLKPLDEVLPAAAAAGVGILARVPLASGLLSGKYDERTEFGADDHRSYNRHGEAFDQGETFSGVDYEAGVAAARRFSALVAAEAPEGVDAGAGGDRVGRAAARRHDRDPRRAIGRAGGVERGGRRGPELGAAFDAGVHAIYDDVFRAEIHARW